MTVHQPPVVHGRRIKLRYAHQGGRNPPRIVIHGNMTSHVPDAYSRYLANMFRKTFDLFATPVSVEFRSERNPYTERLRERRSSSSRPGKATAKNPGSKNRRESVEHAQKKRKKAKRAAAAKAPAGRGSPPGRPGKSVKSGKAGRTGNHPSGRRGRA